MRRRAWRLNDAGVASVLVLGLAGVLCLLGAGGSALAAVGVARHRAASAADLAALAAAARVQQGAGPACAAGHRAAGAVDARLASCAVEGHEVRVVAVVRPPGPLGRLGEASARARAGPATVPPS